MKKVLIVGSQGMLGGALQEEFSSHGYEVLAWDRDECDITNATEMKEKIQAFHPDIVINSAAHNGVDKIEESEEEYRKAEILNGIAPGSIAKICTTLGIVFVHYSTDYVFSGEKKEGYDENDTPSPVSKYGQTKAMGEKTVEENGEKYYIIRLSRLFGNPGKSPQSKKSFVESMLWLATEGGKTELEVVDEEIGSPTFSKDLSIFTRELIESQKPFGIYHGANSGVCTWFELANKVFEIKGLSIATHPVGSDKFPRPAKRPKYSILLNTKMPLQRTWVEALREYLV